MTINDFYAKHGVSHASNIKSYGVKVPSDMRTFSQLDDKKYNEGLRYSDSWVDTRAKFPSNECPSDEMVSFYLGQLMKYNNIDWLTSDELDELLPVMKYSCMSGFGKLGRVLAYFGGIRGMDTYWLDDFCDTNGYVKSSLLPYYTAGTEADLDKEFESLDKELSNEY